MTSGGAGRCRLAVTCVAVSLAHIEANECSLRDGQSGVCCADVTTNQVRPITDTFLPVLTVADTPIIDVAEAEDLLRFGLANNDDIEVETTTTTTTVADLPDDDEQVNFIDDTEPADFHLRFNMPRAESLAVDAEARSLLETTRRLKEANNLTDLQAGIGLRSQFNSDTSEVIDAHCPWTPAPTCDPNQVSKDVLFLSGRGSL